MQQQIAQYIDALKRGWWVAALIALSALSLALAQAYFDTPMYRASASFLVSPLPATDNNEVLRSLSTLDRPSINLTYAEVLESKRIQQQAAISLALKDGELSGYSFTSIVLPDANVIRLTVEGPNPAVAAQLANQVGFHAINFLEERYQVYEMAYLDSATVPNNPFSPTPERDASFALILGLVMGVVLVLLYDQLLVFLRAEEGRPTSVGAD